jgi:hypothetical protein
VLTRLVVQRGLGLVYLLAFWGAFRQFVPLLGERGLEPAREVVELVPFRRSPSIFRLHLSDRFARGAAAVGVVLSLAVLGGLVERGGWAATIPVWIALWALQLSFVIVGRTFYSFGWETLLAEAGFLAIFLGPRSVAPSVVVLWMFRWVAFRVEFGAGLIKLRGDPCWRDLTCLAYHHETQPLPNPLSWYFHHLPMPLHRVEVAANHAAQLVLPFLLFAPQPIAGVAAVAMIVTQCWLILSGNFAWLNLLTIVILCAALPASFLRWLPVDVGHVASTPDWWFWLTVALAVLVAVRSRRPVENLLSKRQAMNATFDRFRLVNTYGAFGSITRHRDELVIEATTDEHPGPEAEWRAYELPAKPGDPRRRPPQVAPYHLRLDWLMWFAALRPGPVDRWLHVLVIRLLEADRDVARLFRTVPFGDEPPTFVRMLRYRYRFTTRAERRETGCWWHRTLVGVELPPVHLAGPDRLALDATRR